MQHILRYLQGILSLFFAFLHVVLLAQDMSFTAQLSTNKVGTQNQFQVTYKLDNASRLEGFKPPSFQDFKVIAGPIQSSSFSSINGNSKSTISFSYFLMPLRTGVIQVPSATAVINGKQFVSNACDITVVKGKVPMSGSAQPVDPFSLFGNQTAPGPKQTLPTPQEVTKQQSSKKEIGDKVFARLDVDKTSCVVGEQVTVEYNIYTQLPMEAALRRPSTAEGFWIQDYAEQNNPQQSERVVIKGKEYRKYTLRKVALFATSTGKRTLPAFEVEGAIQADVQEPEYPNGNDIRGMIGSLFKLNNASKVPITLSSQEVVINVLPIPGEAPQEFAGTVGRFSLESSIDKLELTTDEAATLTVIIRGSGNIKGISKPNIIFPGDFDVFEPKVMDTISNAINDINGYKVFKYTLQPRNTGDIQIPAATFTYFDTDERRYKTLSTTEYYLKVSAGKNITAKAKRSGLPQDIHDIVQDDTMKKSVINLLPESSWYWIAFALPLLILLATNIWAGQKRKNYQSPEQIQHIQVTNAAVQRLSIAQEMLREQNVAAFYNETSKALWLYISDKLSVPLSKLNKDNVLEMLEKLNVASSIRDLTARTAQRCDEVLYGGANRDAALADMKQVYENAKEIITKIEETIA